MPALSSTSKTKSKKTKKTRIFEDDIKDIDNLTRRYVTVIRESPSTTKKKEAFDKQKTEIMKMQFESHKKLDMNKLNQFISQRYGNNKFSLDEEYA